MFLVTKLKFTQRGTHSVLILHSNLNLAKINWIHVYVYAYGSKLKIVNFKDKSTGSKLVQNTKNLYIK